MATPFHSAAIALNPGAGSTWLCAGSVFFLVKICSSSRRMDHLDTLESTSISPRSELSSVRVSLALFSLRALLPYSSVYGLFMNKRPPTWRSELGRCCKHRRRVAFIFRKHFAAPQNGTKTVQVNL